MSIDWEIAAGSVVGRSHVLAGRPNQDAYAVRAGPGALVAVVCDGCGSGAKSEVGAAIGARMVTEQVMRRIADGRSVASPELWEDVRREVLAALGGAARAMGGSLAETVSEMFLFTVLGLAASGDEAAVFGIGDGVFTIGDDVQRIGPFPRNEPPYLGYGLLAREGGGPRFALHRVLDAEDVRAAVIGTDGAADFEEIAGRTLPGSEAGERVGSIHQFWREDRYFKNRDNVRRRLALVNREASRPVWGERRIAREAGLLEDDTTIVAVRRRGG